MSDPKVITKSYGILGVTKVNREKCEKLIIAKYKNGKTLKEISDLVKKFWIKVGEKKYGKNTRFFIPLKTPNGVAYTLHKHDVITDEELKNILRQNRLEIERKRYALRKMRKTIQESQCEICAGTLNLEGHHIKPIIQGGADSSENIMILCSNCHKIITNGYHSNKPEEHKVIKCYSELLTKRKIQHKYCYYSSEQFSEINRSLFKKIGGVCFIRVV
ncbi:MAG: HNH endonuclease signature motif containing protein [Methanoregula sp.]